MTKLIITRRLAYFWRLALQWLRKQFGRYQPAGSYAAADHNHDTAYAAINHDHDGVYLTQHQDISGKQDVINDLADIRSGAALGATALQTHQSLKTINGETITGTGNITIESGGGSLPEVTIAEVLEVLNDNEEE